MLMEHSNYRTFLKTELADRISRNASYSMRSFAQALSLSPSALCEVMKGSKNLSEEMALQIARKLRLSSKEQEYFRLMVLLDRAKKPEIKETALQKIRELNPQNTSYDLSIDLFKVISDWYHFAILACLDLKDFEPNSQNLSKKLGISTLDTDLAIDRLLRLEMIEKDTRGKYRKIKLNPRVVSNAPNESLRNYHRQTLQKAIESLTTQNPSEKIIGSETIAIDPKDLEQYRALTEDYFEKVLNLSKKSHSKKEVYHLGIQFFNLSSKSHRPRIGVPK